MALHSIHVAGEEHWTDMDHPYLVPSSYITEPKVRSRTNLGLLARDSISSTQPAWATSMNVGDLLRYMDYAEASDIDLSDVEDSESSESHADTESEIASIMRTWEVSEILDPTSVEAGFDFECLDCLGELALHDPHRAFEEICWNEALEVNDIAEPASDTMLPAYAESEVFSHKSSLAKLLSGTEQYDNALLDNNCSPEVIGHAPKLGSDLQRIKRQSLVYHLDHKTTFIIFEPPMFNSRNADKIGSCPPPPPTPISTPKKTFHKRIATFCASQLKTNSA